MVLAPYLFRFPQREMIEYFQSLANASPVPLYLYDLPVRTGVEIDLSSYEILAKHPNIRARQGVGTHRHRGELVARFGDRFRVIVAEPKTLDVLLREDCGPSRRHLCRGPAVGQADCPGGRAQDWDRAALYQRKLTEVLELLVGRAEPDGGLHRDDERPRNPR